MDVFRLTYRVDPDPEPRELLLDVLARRWTSRAVVRTVIKYEFPNAPMPPMPAKAWSVDRVLNYVGIYDLACTYPLTTSRQLSRKHELSSVRTATG